MLPNNRLLIWAALLVPIGLISGVIPEIGSVILFLAAAVLAGIALLDAALGAKSIRCVSITIPETIRFTRAKEGSITINISCSGKFSRPISLALGLPDSFENKSDVLSFHIPQNSDNSQTEFPTTPCERGQFLLTAVSIQSPSPLGFWFNRRMFRICTEIRVYPNLIQECGHKAANLLIHRSLGSSPFRQIGQGREFEKLRDYQPGDSYGDIHWKATAKRHHPVTKLFQVERTQEVMAVMDTSRLSAMRPEPDAPRIIERYLAATLVLAQAARKQGDRFGAILFRDRVTQFIPPGGGIRHYDTCRDAIFSEVPSDVSPDFNELFIFLRTRLKRRTLLIIFTSLEDPMLAKRFTEGVKLISSQHLVLVMNTSRPGLQPLFSAPAASPDEIYEHLSNHYFWERKRSLYRDLKQRNVEFIDCQAPDLAADVISRYMKIKSRQQL